MKWIKALCSTINSSAPFLARLTLAIVIFPHGAQKALGWFGGHGFSATMASFTGGMHIPAAFAFLAILAEFGGSIGLFLGFLSRLAAFGIGVVMLVAISKVHMANGFFMNWMGNQKGEGFEYHLLVLGLVLIVLIYGAGRFSVDRLIANRQAQG